MTHGGMPNDRHPPSPGKKGLTRQEFFVIIATLVWFGEMAEWLKALVLKTSDVERHRGFESLSLRLKFGCGEVPKRPKGLPC